MVKECALSTGNLPRGGLPRNSVERITNRLDMTSAVDRGRKALTQPTNQPLGPFVCVLVGSRDRDWSISCLLFNLNPRFISIDIVLYHVFYVSILCTLW